MISAGLHSKFNFIVAPEISSEIEFDYDDNFNDNFSKIKVLKNLEELSNLTNTKPTSSKGRTKKISKQEVAIEKTQLQKELKNKLPYNDISIFRLEKKPKFTTESKESTAVAGKSTAVAGKSTTETEKLLLSSCHYTSSQSKLHLTPVYNCDIVPKAVFILIELTEIHGKEHLQECTMYFKK